MAMDEGNYGAARILGSPVFNKDIGSTRQSMTGNLPYSDCLHIQFLVVGT